MKNACQPIDLYGIPQPMFLKFKKIPHRFAFLVVPCLLSAFMSCVVSFISTIRVHGVEPGLVGYWLSSWGVSWITAFPIAVVVLPLVRRLAWMIVEDKIEEVKIVEDEKPQ